MAQKQIRVLVTDDSATVRNWVQTVLTPEHGFTIVGEARDGLQAVEACARLKPDIVLMDVEMPNADGFHATESIMRQTPVPILIFTSTAVYRSRRVPFRSLSAGALDVMLKPKSVLDGKNQTIADMLRKKLRILANVVVIRRTGVATINEQPLALNPMPRVVAIGASTGGPKAIATLLQGMEPTAPYGVIIVQHMAQEFVPGFIEWLGESLSVPVLEARPGALLEAGSIYVASGSHHVGLAPDRRFLSIEGPPVNECCPSADVLFESVAKYVARDSVGILLTGMGRDGAKGLLSIKKAGGQTMAQDEPSSVIFGMPKVAYELGAVEQVHPLAVMAAALRTRKQEAA